MTNRVAVVGHRGWPTRFPDNTLSGLLAAADVVDAVEIDVRRSADGKLVLAHDPLLGGLVVSDTPWSTLMELDLGDGHHPILLDEALAALPGTPVQLEVKNWPIDPGFEPDHRIALETADRARPGDVVTSFNPVSLETVRRVFPDVPTGRCVTAGTPLDEAVEHCLDAGHRALVPDESMLHEEVPADLEVYPWTVNDPVRARELVELGVTGIITDDPGLVAGIFRSQE
ncbi:MAG TPA: glycerophosphodiester phosphodiesterase [Acidimicrobiia bacterium]|jgi:glycerophosphoryl diester phosphodiesterase|nr:glycerophosphodiester phosphodiesterase [Acidimicrobiia bacterium]